MIQDIAPYQFQNEYRPKPPAKEDYLLCYNGNRALVRQQDGMIAHSGRQRRALTRTGSMVITRICLPLTA